MWHFRQTSNTNCESLHKSLKAPLQETQCMNIVKSFTLRSNSNILSQNLHQTNSDDFSKDLSPKSEMKHETKFCHNMSEWPE